MKTLVLLSLRFPHGLLTETSFIMPEVEALSRHFDRVIVAPEMNGSDVAASTGSGDPGEPVRELPENFIVDDAFSGHPGGKEKMLALFHPSLWWNLFADMGRIKKPGDLRAAFAENAYRLHYRSRLRSLIHRYSLKMEDTLFYSFWFLYVTQAAASLRGAKVVSRVHGFDFDETRGRFLSRALRRKALRRMKGCFAVSEGSREILQRIYPDEKDKIGCRYLGTRETYERVTAAEAGEEKEIKILTCGRVVRVKRVPEQLSLVKNWAQANPERNIRWILLGDGPESEEVRSIAGTLPPNLKVEMRGSVSNDEVHRVLGEENIDLMLLTSIRDTFPVVCMEAMSHGVPVLASRVGGLPEIFGEGGGVLIDGSLDEDEFGRAMHHILSEGKNIGREGRRIWENRFRASALREDFARELRNIVGE